MIANEIFYVESGQKTDQNWTVRISKNGGAYSSQSTYNCQGTTISGLNYVFNCPCQIPADAISNDEYRYQFYPVGDDPDTSPDVFYYPQPPLDPILIGANNGDIYLGQSGSEILLSPFGRKLKITIDEISRGGRTASGRMVYDISSIKYRFELPYSAIDGDKLQDIADLYDLHDDLTLRVYITGSDCLLSKNTGLLPIVRLNPYSQERLLLLGEGMWSDVSLILDEI